MAWVLDKRSQRVLSTVRPELQKVIRRAVEISPVRFAVVSGNRTAAEQRWLYASGRTRAGPKITWTLRSNHMGGRAIDFSLVDGKEVGVPVYWGYDMWKKDFGHIQMVAQ
jgi:peptidoglycan L-alanyl-D-glutamate endopeptidase CwlK